MTSKRKAIRHALRDILLQAATAAETRIETNRASRIWRGKLPAVVIYTLDDSGETDAVAPLSYELEARIAIEIWTTRAGQEEEDDALDDLIEEVENALLPWIPRITSELGGNPSKSGYEGIQAGFDADGELIVAGARLSLRFHYYLAPDYTPTEGLAPFLLAHVDHQVSSSETPDAEDDIQLPQ